MNPSELTGKILGYPLGLIPLVISFLRDARTFHPQGIVMSGRVNTVENSLFPLHPHVMIRFSGALWKKSTILPDVLGIAIRFSENQVKTPMPHQQDQDLLFATIRHPILTPVGPITTRYKRFQNNTFYAVSPFTYKEKKVKFKLTLENFKETDQGRNQNLLSNTESDASLRLWTKEKHRPWKCIADINLMKVLSIDQQELCFNPFRTGLNIKPKGFVHHLRYAVYPMSQFGRHLRHTMKDMLNKSKDRMIVEGL